ncbi:ATP-binding cassette domain-containing protein [Lysobacter enzymogenes]|uniref:ATP-binding cassette domain-containing protein n=1 Tax=Lysobacter enzymogenes TaxID=69 RepID=UPI00099B907E|nr:ATP-binding cassette domain-containing protein [Lysobacter enzymogenes]UZW61652.1 ATP-binding cassette domain-containing protein [Lysobacter enzymogenes]
MSLTRRAGNVARVIALCFRFPIRQMRWRRRTLYRIFAVHLLVTFGWSFGDPLLQKLMVDHLVAKDFAGLAAVLAAMLGIYAVVHYLSWKNQLAQARVHYTLQARLIDRAAASLYAERIGRDRNAGAKLLGRLHAEPAQLTELVQFDLEAIGILAGGIFALVFCSLVSPFAVLPLLILVPLVLYMTVRDFGSTQTAAVRVERRKNEAIARLSENLDALPLFAPFRLLGRVRRSIALGFLPYQRSAYALSASRAKVSRDTRMMMTTAELLVILTAAMVVIYAQLSIGAFFALTASYWRLVGSLREFAERLPNLPIHYGRIRRFERFCARAPGRWYENAWRDARGEALELRRLSLRLDAQRSVGPIDLRVEPGRSLILLGPNGAGKSTLLGLIAGNGMEHEGELRTPSPISLALSPPRFPHLSASRLLALDARKPLDRDRLLGLAQRLGLNLERLQEVPGHWSDGEKRRLAILLALSKPAALYLFDEPLSGVDIQSKDELLRLILEETSHAVCVVALHEPDMAARFSQRLDIEPGVRPLPQAPVPLALVSAPEPEPTPEYDREREPMPEYASPAA